MFSVKQGFDVQEADFLSESKFSDIDPVVYCLDEQCKFAHNMLTAPSLLLCHHLKSLSEISSVNNSQQSISFALDENQQQLVTGHASGTVRHAPPIVCLLNLGSSPDSPLDMASAS